MSTSLEGRLKWLCILLTLSSWLPAGTCARHREHGQWHRKSLHPTGRLRKEACEETSQHYSPLKTAYREAWRRLGMFPHLSPGAPSTCTESPVCLEEPQPPHSNMTTGVMCSLSAEVTAVHLRWQSGHFKKNVSVHGLGEPPGQRAARKPRAAPLELRGPCAVCVALWVTARVARTPSARTPVCGVRGCVGYS